MATSGSVKMTPKFVEPRVGRQSNPTPSLASRAAPPPEGKWLLYQLPDWIHDDNVKSCLNCSNKFHLLNRRHHCRACGGIYCGDCAKESWVLPQFNVHTPERLCTTCMNTQSTVLDLHSKLTTTRNSLSAHNARHQRLMECSQTLQIGAMFNVFIDGSMRPRKLALSDDLLMIALINTRTNKVTNAYEVTQISINTGMHEDAAEAIGGGGSQLCFMMACHDHVFTLQALNLDLFQYWVEGIHLAQEMVMHMQTVQAYEQDISETSAKLHTAIQSQINFALPKVFPEPEPNSALTLVEDNEDQRLTGETTDSDAESSTLGRSKEGANGVNGDAADASSLVETAPPAALKMGRSVPRTPGYMSPTYGGGGMGPASPIALSPVPASPVSSVLSDDSPTASFQRDTSSLSDNPFPRDPALATTTTTATIDSTTLEPENLGPKSVDVHTIVSGIATTNLTASSMSTTFDSLPSTPEASDKLTHQQQNGEKAPQSSSISIISPPTTASATSSVEDHSLSSVDENAAILAGMSPVSPPKPIIDLAPTSSSTPFE